MLLKPLQTLASVGDESETVGARLKPGAIVELHLHDVYESSRLGGKGNSAANLFGLWSAGAIADAELKTSDGSFSTMR